MLGLPCVFRVLVDTSLSCVVAIFVVLVGVAVAVAGVNRTNSRPTFTVEGL